MGRRLPGGCRIGYVSIQICALLTPVRLGPPGQRPILNATTSPLYARRCTSLSERLHRRLASTLRVGLRSNRNLPLSSDKLPAGWVSTGCLSSSDWPAQRSQATAFSQGWGDAVSHAQAGRRFMRVPTIVLAVATIGLGSTASADPYKDLATQGYRWVIVDGPYACPSKDDLREITRHHTDRIELEMVENLRAYYLIRGTIIQVVQEDAASGISEVHLPGGFRTFWTVTRFLSRSPIRDTFGVVQTPTTSDLLLQGQTVVASPTPSEPPKTDAGALNQQDATPTPRPK
jgi:hypothetical protein